MKGKMTSSFLAFFGHINIDVSIRVPVLPRVGSVNATGVTENFGGTAGNFALVAKKLGLDFDLYSAVSPKTHSEYMEYLAEMGMDLGHVDILKDSYGPVCYISSDGNDQVAYVYQGPMDVWDPAGTFPTDSTYEWVHFSTGMPGQYSKLFDKISGSKVAFDPGQEIHYRYDRNIMLKFIERADMFIGNETEYGKMQDLSGLGHEDIISRIGTVIITKGQNGVIAFHEGKTFNYNIMQAERVHDTIGAGDSFRAGFYFGLWKGMGVKESVAMGIITSSKAIELPMTQFSLSGEGILELFRSNSDRIIRE